MRLGKTYLLLSAIFLLVLHLFQVPSYSLIRSRIQGTFRDKETGQPLEGVVVTLFKKGPVKIFPNYEETTGNDGRFIFDQIKYGEYYIRGEKPGYVPYQPLFKIMRAFNLKLAEVILIGEGEIRHFDIQMEQGGQLLAKIFKKDENGVSPYTKFSAQIGFKAGDKITDIYTLGGISKGGEYFADGLQESDRYTLRVSAVEHTGYPKFETKFEIKKNEITTIEHTFDFTDNTGVTGVIYLDNEPISIAGLYLVNSSGYTIAETSVSKASRYTFKNIEPGLYSLFYFFIEDEKRYWSSRKVLIENGILKNFDFKVKR
jgi:hypothetical protein